MIALELLCVAPYIVRHCEWWRWHQFLSCQVNMWPHIYMVSYVVLGTLGVSDIVAMFMRLSAQFVAALPCQLLCATPQVAATTMHQLHPRWCGSGRWRSGFFFFKMGADLDKDLATVQVKGAITGVGTGAQAGKNGSQVQAREGSEARGSRKGNGDLMTCIGVVWVRL